MTDDKQGQDERRVAEIRARLEAATPGPWQTWTDGTEESVESVSVGRFVCHLNSNMRQFREDAAFIAHAREDVPYLLARLAAAEAALAPCTLAREYRDGVTCRDERDDKGVCFNHRVVRGLRVHAVTADRLELENRALRRQVRATYGIIHEGLHGGKPTDPEHQELCERPACRNARAALAGSTGGQEREGEGE